MTTAWYNDSEPYVVSWLGNLIEAGHITAGVVDGRPIEQIRATDVAGYTRCHYFAGIAGWDLALQLAGWPADRPVWTGSCPCQPFSQAGKRRGEEDPRHLWPVWRQLITQCHPPTIFGEQVASDDGREWLSGVRADLEALGYAVGAADLCAAGVGAPHIRQRLWWVAHTQGDGWGGGEGADQGNRATFGDSSGVGNPDSKGLAGWEGKPSNSETPQQAVERAGGAASGVGNPLRQRWEEPSQRYSEAQPGGKTSTPRPDTNRPSSWAVSDSIRCYDAKARRIEPGTQPLAHGVPQRVGQLRAYGNSIVPQVAAGFVQAFLEIGG